MPCSPRSPARSSVRSRPTSVVTSSASPASKPAQVKPFDEVKGADRGRPEARAGAAEIRRQGRPVPEPRLRAGRLAASRWARSSTSRSDDAVAHAQPSCSSSGRQSRNSPQALFSPASLTGEAQHRGDRGRAQYADRRPHRRVQAGGAAAVRRGQGRDPPAARVQGRRRKRAQRAGRDRSSRCWSRASRTRRPASCSASRSS